MAVDEGGPQPAAPRPDTDDYDLLTYGEAAARLAEAVEQDRRRLAELEASGGDSAQIASLRRRIELMIANDARYRQQSLSGAAFIRKFGFQPRPQ